MKRRGRPPHPDILTPREWEVLDLLRAGLTNEQIANQLGISLQGAKFHVSEILGKLQLPDRRAAAAWRPPERRRVAPVLAPLFFVPRRLASAARWRASQLALAIGSALVLAVVVGTAVVAAVLLLRSRAGPPSAQPGQLEVGANVDVPLLLHGDRLGVSSLDGATPDAFTPPGTYGDVQFDAAGRILYYVPAGQQPGFYRVEDGSSRRVIPVANPVNQYSIPTTAAWSPDGSRAAWIESDGRLRIAGPDTQPRTVALDGIGGLLWAPAGDRLMAWTAGPQVWIVDADTGVTTRTAASPPDAWSAGGDIAWIEPSPDGSGAGSMMLSREGGTEVHNLGPVFIPPEGGGGPAPSFSPDGRYLAWAGASSLTSTSQLHVVEVRTATAVAARCPACPIPVYGGMVWPPAGVSDAQIRGAVDGGALVSLSPDGSRVAYTRQNAGDTSTLYTRPMGGGNETRVVQVTDTRELRGQMAWSPDGSRLVVPLQVAESNTIYAFDPADGQLRNLGTQGPSSIPVLTSAGGSAYYDAGTTTVHSLVDGHVIGQIRGGVVTDLSRDGTRALVSTEALYVADTATGGRTKLLDDCCQDAVWSPDGTQVAYIRNQRLGVLDVATGTTRDVAPDITAMYSPAVGGDGYITWSPDGSSIVAGDWKVSGINGSAQLFVIDARTGARRQVTTTAASYRYHAFSPDGRRLAFVDQEKGVVWVRDLSSGALTSSPASGNAFAWVSNTQIVAGSSEGIALVAAGGPNRLLVQNTGGCTRFLVGWAAPDLVFSDRCSHRGL